MGFVFKVSLDFPRFAPHDADQNSTHSNVRYYKSIRQASKDLDMSYYFLWNCYHGRHHNQFSRFVVIERLPEFSEGDQVITVPCERPVITHTTNELQHGTVYGEMGDTKHFKETRPTATWFNTPKQNEYTFWSKKGVKYGSYTCW